MHKKFSISEINSALTSNGYDLLETYVMGDTRVIIEDKNGYKYDTVFRNIKNGHPPFSINITNPFSLDNMSKWLVLNDKPFILCEKNEYKGSNVNLDFKCLNCEEFFPMTWANVSRGQGCSICSGQRVGKNNSFAHLSPDLLQEWDFTKNKISPYSITKSSGKKIWWICGDCGNSWNAKVNNRNNGKGCPFCSSSKGETLIRNILNSYKINKIEQYRFESLLKYPFDFYLPENEICIEYQGLHHYEPVDFGSNGIEWANIQLLKQKDRDSIKKKYCLDKSIRFLEIPYWEFKNTEGILVKALKI